MIRIIPSMLVAALLASAAAASPAAGNARGPRCAIAVAADGAISASITDASLREVVAELSRHTGVEVIWIGRPSEQRLTLAIRDLPVSEAIARILSSLNHVILLSGDALGRRRLQVRIGSAVAKASPATPRSLGAMSHVLSGDDGFRPPSFDALPEALDPDVGRRSPAHREVLSELPSEALESITRDEIALRPLAVDLLLERAEYDMSAYVALDHLASDGEDPSLSDVAVQALADLDAAARARLSPQEVADFERLLAGE